jgi:stress response protein YsnF
MSRTVTALYDSRAEAEAARQRLSSAVDVEKMNIIDQQAAGQSGRGLNDYHLSSEDRHAYGEGLRRGGALLVAEVDGDENPDTIVKALEETPSVDLEDRQRGWQQEGWSPYSGRSGLGESGGTPQSALAAGTTSGTGATGNIVEEDRIPIIEEEIRIGKREVERGGARVRSYIRETPVHEQVTLREEHIEVERRPVESQTLRGGTAGQEMLQERTIEMVAKGEEAVVEKVANVREEIVVKKTAEEHTEQVEDSVRRTEVEVDEGSRASSDRSAFGGFGSGSDPDRNPR